MNTKSKQKKKESKLAGGDTRLYLSTREAVGGRSELKASLGDRVSSKTVRATGRYPVLEKQKQTNKQTKRKGKKNEGLIRNVKYASFQSDLIIFVFWGKD